MSDKSNFGFAQLIPGFDFLQNLAKGASASLPQMPNLSNWVAPTINVEELEKRIAELKAVHFWLEQNSKALGATIQALEVQKMTLATLQGMNFSMGDLANALKLKTAETMASGMQKASEATAQATEAPREKAKPAKTTTAKKAGNGAASPAIDPLQWWGSLTQQFQQIAANAMKDVAEKTAVTTQRGAAAAAGAFAAPAQKAPAAPAKKTARKAPARKTRAKTTS